MSIPGHNIRKGVMESPRQPLFGHRDGSNLTLPEVLVGFNQDFSAGQSNVCEQMVVH